MKDFEFETENPERMVMHRGGVCSDICLTWVFLAAGFGEGV